MIGETKIKVSFMDFSCGRFITDGWLTGTQIPSPWLISNDQFTVVIKGTFDRQTHVAGTYDADYEGSIFCNYFRERTAKPRLPSASKRECQCREPRRKEIHKAHEVPFVSAAHTFQAVIFNNGVILRGPAPFL
jgi:hypothetical protein